jgi:hypothetical protein
VNVEAEIDNLKLRVQALEATLPPHRASTAKSIDIDQVAYILTEISQDLAALGDEIAGLRRHISQYVFRDQSTMLNKLDAIHCETIALGLKFDQLLDKDDA